jgi:hypothetical protein
MLMAPQLAAQAELAAEEPAEALVLHLLPARLIPAAVVVAAAVREAAMPAPRAVQG